MLAATVLVHLPNGFFSINGRCEVTLVLIAATMALILAGSGEAALDGVLVAYGGLAPARLLCPLKVPSPR